MNTETPRFIDNGDGTVTDTKLGLMWSKATITEADVTQHQAEDLCRELRLADHADWRLPTVDELFALADRSRYNPAIDTEAFPDTSSDWYWTSTITAWSSSHAWYLYFSYGYANHSTPATAASASSVRFVRCRPVSKSAF